MTTPTSRRSATLLATVALTLTVSACTASGSTAPSRTQTVVSTSTAPPSSIAPESKAPIAPTAPVQEIAAPDNTCPWISNDAARAAEGDRVGRVTLTTSTPPGCNFYWPYQDNPIILAISVTNYPDQISAYNAMIRASTGSSEVIGVPGLIPSAGCSASTPQSERPTTCVDAVLYRTAFSPPTDTRDWAAVFAKNKRVITVKTRQNDVSFNAKNIAAQIAPKF